MKVTRRSFIGLIPAIVIGVASVAWFVEKETPRTYDYPVLGSRRSVDGSNLRVFDFPVTWNGDSPLDVNLRDYRLRVDGEVSNPLELSIEDLQALPIVARQLTINCVEGWSAEVTWEGIPVSDLLRMAEAPNSIDHVTFESATGYNTRISGSDIASPDNMIALRAGFVPLTIDHG